MDRLQIFGRMMAAFMFAISIIGPSILEIILATQQSKNYNMLMMTLYGGFQAIIAVYLGLRLGIFTIKRITIHYSVCIKETEKQKLLDELDDSEGMCQCPINYNFIFTIAFMAACLPISVLTNIVISLAIGSTGMPVYVNILVYLPLIMFILFYFVGIAYQKAITIEETWQDMPSSEEENK